MESSNSRHFKILLEKREGGHENFWMGRRKEAEELGVAKLGHSPTVPLPVIWYRGSSVKRHFFLYLKRSCKTKIYFRVS